MPFGAIGRTTVRQRSVVEALRMLMELARGPQGFRQAAPRGREPVAPACCAHHPGSAVKRRRPPRT
jgi:hypothetical protein